MEEENEEQKEEDLATLRTKTRPWIRVGIRILPRVSFPPRNRATLVPHGCPWSGRKSRSPGASSPGFNVGRWKVILYLEWSLGKYIPRRILLLDSHVMETTSNIGGNIVVIKIRAILLRFVAATKGSLTRYNTSRKTSVYNIQETDTLCYPCHQCWPTLSAKNRSLLISCFLVVSCSIVSISLINQPEKKIVIESIQDILTVQG